jgi:predicted transcriptional regulator
MDLGAYRLAKGIGVADLARHLGISLSSAYRYTRGERVPPRNVVVKIRRLTDGAVTADDFYPDETDG